MYGKITVCRQDQTNIKEIFYEKSILQQNLQKKNNLVS